MASKYPEEVAAIHQLRDMFPTVPQKTLARQITRTEFFGTAFKLAQRANGRSLLSIYSVIRRYDASKAIKTTVAA